MITQLPLIEDAAPPRPREKSPETIRAAAEAMLPEIIDWLKGGGGYYDYDNDEEVLAGLVEAMDRARSLDGLKIARQLEDWEADFALAEILNQAEQFVREAHDKALEAWVAGWAVEPKHPVGTLLSLVVDGQRVEGTVVSIDRRRATYTINIPAHGHVQPGRSGAVGRVLTYEEVES